MRASAASARAASRPSEEALAANARLLETVLEDYGVRGRIAAINPGPGVTLYELEPAPGTKSARVIGLADDIARNMHVTAVRIATVPGRNVIGIDASCTPAQTKAQVLEIARNTAALVGAGEIVADDAGDAIVRSALFTPAGSDLVVDWGRLPLRVRTSGVRFREGDRVRVRVAGARVYPGAEPVEGAVEERVAVAEVGAQREHGPGHPVPRSRHTTTATSSNARAMGADGLWTVTSTARTRATTRSTFASSGTTGRPNAMAATAAAV